MKRLSFSQRGFTLAELTIAMGMGLIVSMLSFSYLRAGSVLFAKNISVNLSNNDLRGSIDQIDERLQSALTVPVLINTSGTATTSPSAGVYYDRLLGDPYVVTHPGGSGLSSTATSVTVTRSTDVYASPPIPQAGDVLLIDGAADTLRPLVSSVSAGTISGGLQTITITLASALGSDISWDSSYLKTAKLVRREAIIVMPSGTRSELRRYSAFETTTNLSDATKYSVISRQIGAQGTEVTPFSIVSVGLDKLLNIDLRVRPRGFENVLANKEYNSFSSYMRVQCMIPSRLRPKN